MTWVTVCTRCGLPASYASEEHAHQFEPLCFTCSRLCPVCAHYRMALRAIADAARQGVAGGGLGDLAELALQVETKGPSNDRRSL